jgi:hypothetical protein
LQDASSTMSNGEHHDDALDLSGVDDDEDDHPTSSSTAAAAITPPQSLVELTQHATCSKSKVERRLKV